VVTADHRRVPPLLPLAALPDTDEAIGGYLRARSLLEASCDVHRVAGDEPLACHRVPGDDLARVDAGADRQADTPVPLELVVQLALHALHVRGGSNGP